MKFTKRILSLLLAVFMAVNMLPLHAHAAEADATLTASLNKAKTYIDGITINNSSNDPATVVKNFKTHFTWDNEKREDSKTYLFDWSYYNGVVFEGIEYVYEVTGESVYKDYVIEYMSNLIASNGTWAKCSNNSSKECAGYNSSHGADCYKTASLLLDAYEMTKDNRYLTMAATLYADLDNAAKSYSLKNAGNNYRHTWSSDPSPDLWLDGLYMILPFRAEYAKYTGDQDELDLIVSRMQWVSDNMYNSSKKLFYHAADNASSHSGTYWLRSIGWYAAAIVDIMDHMEGDNLEAMKAQLVKLVDGMKVCQNASNGMWLNNMAASQSSTNPYETSGTALVCYAVMKAVNNGWLDESYADMAILAFNGICNEKLSGSNLKDICFKGAPGSSNSTFYDNEGKGLGPFIMFYAEVLKYVNTEDVPEETVPETTVPETTAPAETEPEETEPDVTVPTDPDEGSYTYTGKGNLVGSAVYTRDKDGINSGEKYLIVYSGRALQNNNGVDANPTVTISNETITLEDDSKLAWTITQSSGSNYYVENNGSYVNLKTSGDDPIGSQSTVYITRNTDKYRFRNASGSGAYLRYSSSQLFCAGTSSSNYDMHLYRRTSVTTGSEVVFTLSPAANVIKPGNTLALNAAVTVAGQPVSLSNCTINWTSSDNAVATVSNGTVTGVASGSATITATITAANGKALMNSIVLTVPVTVQGHSYRAVVTAPTCENAGYTTYICTTCGDSYVADQVDALGHKYQSVVTAPTCTEKGYTTYTCTVCGNSYQGDHTEAAGHHYESETEGATCTEDGLITYTCSGCGDSYTETVSATGHDYQCTVTDATCGADGRKVYRCSNCGDAYTEIIPATGIHNYKTSVKEATCTADGLITYTCDCGAAYTEVIKAAGHNYESVVTAPTCENKGYTTHTCSVCGDSYVTDEVAALGHKYETVVTAPTCTAYGYTTYICSKCGDTYDADKVEALGHKYETVVTAPTCTAFGYTTYTCSGCGDSYDADRVEALGHSYTTTDQNGVLTHTCDVCGDSYVEALEWVDIDGSYARLTGELIQTVADTDYVTVEDLASKLIIELSDNGSDVTDTVIVTADMLDWYDDFDGNMAGTYAANVFYEEYILGTITVTVIGNHNYETVVVYPTCTEEGYTEATCTECGFVHRFNYTDMLGHSYTYTDSGDTRTHTCIRCSDSYTEKLALSCKQVSKFTSGKRFVITIKSGGKYYAMSHEGNSIRPVQITVSSGKITSGVTDDLLWSYTNGKLSYENEGTTFYLYTYTSGPWYASTTYMGIGTSSAATVSYSNNRLKIGSLYLRYSSSKFALNSAATSVYLFMEQ